jgi:hypothetical protein
LGDGDEDGEDNDEETGRWPSDDAMLLLHEEEEAIGSIPASD